VLLEKLTITQLVKKFLAFCGTLRLVRPDTSPCSEPDESNPHPLTLFP